MDVDVLYDRQKSNFNQQLFQLMDIANEIEKKALPLFKHLRSVIETYDQTQPHDKVKVVGSFGNCLQLPEIHKDGVYCVEIDLLFERNSDNFHIPNWSLFDIKHDGTLYRVKPVSSNYDSLYVWLEVNQTSGTEDRLVCTPETDKIPFEIQEIANSELKQNSVDCEIIQEQCDVDLEKKKSLTFNRNSAIKDGILPNTQYNEGTELKLKSADLVQETSKYVVSDNAKEGENVIPGPRESEIKKLKLMTSDTDVIQERDVIDEETKKCAVRENIDRWELSKKTNIDNNYDGVNRTVHSETFKSISNTIDTNDSQEGTNHYNSVTCSDSATASSECELEIDYDTSFPANVAAQDFDEERKVYFLTNRFMRDNIPSGVSELPVNEILGEREIDQANYDRRPFRTYKSNKQVWVETTQDSAEEYNFFCLFDKVVGIKLPWPNCASSFFERSRKWPPKGIMEQIQKDGCHVIPKTSVSESYRDWKYTFAEAEQTVVRHFTDTQRFMFMIFKQIKRRFLDVTDLYDGSVGIQSGLTSYHLKTIMLWVCEQRLPEEWDADPAGSMTALLTMLHDSLRSGFLPHYIIPEINVYPRLWKIWERKDKVLSIQETFKPQLKEMLLTSLVKRMEDILQDKESYFLTDIMYDVDHGHKVALNSRLASESIFSLKYGNIFPDFPSFSFTK